MTGRVLRFCRSRLPLVMLVLALTASHTARSHTVFRGDVNHDGKVTLADAVLALRMATGLVRPTDDDLIAADVAPSPGVGGRDLGDGKISAADVVRILRYVVGLIGSDEFYGHRPAVVQTGHAELRLSADTLTAGRTPAGSDAVIEVLGIGLERVVAGAVTLKIDALGGSPPMVARSVSPGGLLPDGTSVSTVPEQIPVSGGRVVRAAFQLFGKEPLTGTGTLFKIFVQLPKDAADWSRYRLSLSDVDFTDEDANAVPLAPAEVTVAPIPVVQ